jgi:uncharacterized membrane protein (DUF2068 family)
VTGIPVHANGHPGILYPSAVDWSLRHCARKGHVTYAPTEPDLRRRLHAATPAGEAWRCLRCGDFVPGTPRGSGPAEDAPPVPRGRVLRDLFILRLLAVERAGRGVLILLLVYGVVRFRDRQADLRRAFDEDMPLLRPLADKLHFNLDDSGVVHTIQRVLSLETRTLFWIAIGLAAYALIELVEGVGLWYALRWAEYLTVVATAAFLPLEIYELTEKITWLRIGALVINIAAVIYLLLAKRLFGLRGGHRAVEAERHSESLLEVEHAAGDDRHAPHRADPAPR